MRQLPGIGVRLLNGRRVVYFQMWIEKGRYVMRDYTTGEAITVRKGESGYQCQIWDKRDILERTEA